MNTEEADAWLTAQLIANESRAVTYSRGSGSTADTADVDAVVDSTVFRVDNGFGVFIRVESRDYLIQASELASFTEPQRGDVILDTINSHVEKFEVMAPGAEDVYRYEDEFRKVFRIHTKHMGRQS